MRASIFFTNNLIPSQLLRHRSCHQEQKPSTLLMESRMREVARLSQLTIQARGSFWEISHLTKSSSTTDTWNLLALCHRKKYVCQTLKTSSLGRLFLVRTTRNMTNQSLFSPFRTPTPAPCASKPRFHRRSPLLICSRLTPPGSTLIHYVCLAARSRQPSMSNVISKKS